MKTIIHASSYSNLEEYNKEANKQILSILSVRLRYVGLGIEDITDPIQVQKWNIHKEVKKTESSVHEIYIVSGITLLEALWDMQKCTIDTKAKDPDYSDALQYIAQMEQK